MLSSVIRNRPLSLFLVEFFKDKITCPWLSDTVHLELTVPKWNWQKMGSHLWKKGHHLIAKFACLRLESSGRQAGKRRFSPVKGLSLCKTRAGSAESSSHSLELTRPLLSSFTGGCGSKSLLMNLLFLPLKCYLFLASATFRKAVTQLWVPIEEAKIK